MLARQCGKAEGREKIFCLKSNEFSIFPPTLLSYHGIFLMYLEVNRSDPVEKKCIIFDPSNTKDLLSL